MLGFWDPLAPEIWHYLRCRWAGQRLGFCGDRRGAHSLIVFEICPSGTLTAEQCAMFSSNYIALMFKVREQSTNWFHLVLAARPNGEKQIKISWWPHTWGLQALTADNQLPCTSLSDESHTHPKRLYVLLWLSHSLFLRPFNFLRLFQKQQLMWLSQSVKQN